MKLHTHKLPLCDWLAALLGRLFLQSDEDPSKDDEPSEPRVK